MIYRSFFCFSSRAPQFAAPCCDQRDPHTFYRNPHKAARCILANDLRVTGTQCRNPKGQATNYHAIPTSQMQPPIWMRFELTVWSAVPRVYTSWSRPLVLLGWLLCDAMRGGSQQWRPLPPSGASSTISKSATSKSRSDQRIGKHKCAHLGPKNCTLIKQCLLAKPTPRKYFVRGLTCGFRRSIGISHVLLLAPPT